MRHLKELLREDQEPFYIAEKKCDLIKQPCLRQQQQISPYKGQNQLKKKARQNASFQSNICKNACFFSSAAFHVDSPDYSKSPLLSPSLGNKSPSRAMLLHVPAKTAALLLEAACKIHRNSSKISPKSQTKNSGFGLLGSVIKRLTNRTRTRTGKPEPEIRVGSDLVEKSDLVEDQTGFTNGRLSSVWSEENKSLPCSSSSSTSCSRTASGNLSEVEEESKIEDFTFCLSPLSPFRFALQKSPSPGRKSPATSPSRRKFQENVDSSLEFQAEEEEEEKEQCSPVSVLDPPFGDEDCEEEEEGVEDEDKFDMECSYAFVQRAKKQLLQKLRKFERLAELDPIELEKLMVEDQDEDNYEEDLEYEADKEEDDVSTSMEMERNIDYYLVDIARRSGLVQDLVNPGMKKLLTDLVSEEEKFGDDYESLIKRVCKRLESWKEVEPNTIEMMVSMDLKGENDMWNKPREEISQTAKMMELSIFAVLLDELIVLS